MYLIVPAVFQVLLWAHSGVEEDKKLCAWKSGQVRPFELKSE